MPIDRAATLRNAEKLIRQGKLPDAIAEYVRLVDDQPGDWNLANSLGLPDALQRRIEIDANDRLALQTVGRFSLPSGPNPVAGIGLKWSVVNLLGQGHAGFNDDVRRGKHVSQPVGTFSHANTVADAFGDALGYSFLPLNLSLEGSLPK